MFKSNVCATDSQRSQGVLVFKMSRSHQAVYQYSIFIPCHKNTANHNTRKPLYIGRYYIQPSHHAPRSLIVLATVFSMAWYEIVIDLFSCSHREKATLGIFLGIALELGKHCITIIWLI